MVQALGSRLRTLVDALDGAVDHAYRAASLDFRARFYPYFRMLADRDQLSVGDFALALGVSQPAATQSLALMRDAGLVELTQSADRRERRYRLTEKSRAMLPELESIWEAVGGAADRLDRQLPAPLGATVEKALDLLSTMPFSRMIQEELRRAETIVGHIPAVAALGGDGAAEDRPG